MFNSIYANRKVFVTGHTGFKGAWLTLWLEYLGAYVLGYSLLPNTTPNLHTILNGNGVYGDIRDSALLQKTLLSFQPDIIFHLAAQPLVRLSYTEPILTYETNVLGTLNVLEASKMCPSVKAFVTITTDKCYENKEIPYGYTEEDSLGGYDMYSSSKACVEIMSSSYRRSFLQNGKPFALATARAGNVIGGGDWATDRLIPDCIRSIQENKDILIRNPNAIRPWQHVLEPLSGYLLLGQLLLEHGDTYAQAFNFGPEDSCVLTVADVAHTVVSSYGKGNILIQENSAIHEATLLSLNIEKVKRTLGWFPTYTASSAIEKTVDWYKLFYQGNHMESYSLQQIHEFQKDALWNKN